MKKCESCDVVCEYLSGCKRYICDSCLGSVADHLLSCDPCLQMFDAESAIVEAPINLLQILIAQNTTKH